MDFRQRIGPHRWMSREPRRRPHLARAARRPAGHAGLLRDRAIHAQIGRRRPRPHPLDRPEGPRPQQPCGPHKLRRRPNVSQRTPDRRRAGGLLGPGHPERQDSRRALGAGRLPLHHVHPAHAGIPGAEIATVGSNVTVDGGVSRFFSHRAEHGRQWAPLWEPTLSPREWPGKGPFLLLRFGLRLWLRRGQVHVFGLSYVRKVRIPAEKWPLPD